MEKPKKVCVIGLDCALPNRILKFVDQGALPNLGNAIKHGAMAKNGLVPYPTITPPNWTTIATGAWPGTHGITDFWVHDPGTDIQMSNTYQGFDRKYYHVENIWEAVEKVGKKSIVLNYPASYGAKLKDGIVVGGMSNIINDLRTKDLPGTTGKFTVCTDQIYSTLLYPQGGVKVAFDDAEDWANVPSSDGDDDQEAEIPLTFRDSAYEMEAVTWYALAQDTKGEGYDRLTLSPTKDYSDAFCTLSKGQWSSSLTAVVKTTDGAEKEVRFHVKLMEFSEDLEVFRLYMTGLGECDGWSDPPEVAREIMAASPDSDFSLRGGGVSAYIRGWIDLDTYVEASNMENLFLEDAAVYLLKNKEWDLFYMHVHPTDWMYHAFMKDLDPATEKDPEKNRKAEEAEKEIYKSVDQLVGRIMETAGEETLFVIVSDHGATADGPGAKIPALEPLIEGGFIKVAHELEVEKSHMGKEVEFDWTQTKAVPQRMVHIYLNVKGRDPQGIVEPGEEYERVRQEVIDTLMNYEYPDTGERMFSMALRREDARPFGLYGDRCGDIIYAIYPWFGGQHGNILPTADWGVGTLKATIILKGPGIREGEMLERTIWITDLVPTICYLMDLPLPDHAEGAVVYQAFEDPDFKEKEIQQLKDRLAELESKLA